MVDRMGFESERGLGNGKWDVWGEGRMGSEKK